MVDMIYGTDSRVYTQFTQLNGSYHIHVYICLLIYLYTSTNEVPGYTYYIDKIHTPNNRVPRIEIYMYTDRIQRCVYLYMYIFVCKFIFVCIYISTSISYTYIIYPIVNINCHRDLIQILQSRPGSSRIPTLKAAMRWSCLAALWQVSQQMPSSWADF